MSLKITPEDFYSRFSYGKSTGHGRFYSLGRKFTTAMVAAGTLLMQSQAMAQNLEAPHAPEVPQSVASQEISAKAQALDPELLSKFDLSNLSPQGSPPSADTNTELKNLESRIKSDFYASSEKLKPIEAWNYESIFKNQESGIYQHPFDENDIIAVRFVGDHNGDSKIKEQLESKGIGTLGFTFQKFLASSRIEEANHQHQEAQSAFSSLERMGIQGDVNNNNVSFQLQETFNIGHDVNYTYIDTNILQFDNAELADKYGKYSQYQTFTHEAMHALESQNISTIPVISSLFGNEKPSVLMIENGADFGSLIKTIQLMDKEGMSQSDINEYIDYTIDFRNKSGGFDVDHYSVPSLKIVKDMYNKNPNQLLNLDDQQIVSMSDMVSAEVVDYDYRADIENNYHHNLDREKIHSTMERFSKKIDQIIEHQGRDHLNGIQIGGDGQNLSTEGNILRYIVETAKANPESFVNMSEGERTKFIDGAISKSPFQDGKHLYLDSKETQNVLKKSGLDSLDGVSSHVISKFQESDLWFDKGSSRYQNQTLEISP